MKCGFLWYFVLNILIRLQLIADHTLNVWLHTFTLEQLVCECWSFSHVSKVLVSALGGFDFYQLAVVAKS